MNITPAEAQKLEAYLRQKLNKGISIKARAQAPDSVEVMVDGEFIATIYKDEDEGETCFTLNMAILDIDLDGEAAA